MGKALYRKHRSKKLAEVIGQEHITDTLNKALKQDRISHAYLFTGPRGVGKTSVARILAHDINKLPYEDDSTHIDIIEIDAASNRRIDEIRELRDKVYVAPVEAAYKVYIIDEVHMLTREAFNALLKTLEEPPSHVVFILATTDAHKLPETIISRTQRFTFRPVALDKVTNHLTDIAKKEKIDIDKGALSLIATHGEGSFRDSISLLDQAAGMNKHVTATDIENLLGLPSEKALAELYEVVMTGTSAELMKKQQSLLDHGYHPSLIAKEFSALVRSRLSSLDDAQATEALLALLTGLLDVASSPRPDRLLELQLLKARTAIMPQSPATGGSAPSARPATTASSPPSDRLQSQSKPIAPPISSTPPALPESKPTEAKAPPTKKEVEPPVPTNTEQKPFDLGAWGEVLDLLKKRHNTLYGVIRMAQPQLIEDQTLQLQFSFAFHQKRISEPANRKILIGIVKEVTGTTYAVECIHNKEARPPKLTAMQPHE